MHIHEFRQFQRQSAAHDVFSLVMTCRRKFLNAARLLELRSDAINQLEPLGVRERVDIRPLLTPFSVLTERYTVEFFSPQESLFQETSQKQDVKWDRYLHQILVPHLIGSDEVVRNVLRAVRGLPSQHPELASAALGQHFTEMTLPNTSPPWAPEDEVDF